MKTVNWLFTTALVVLAVGCSDSETGGQSVLAPAEPKLEVQTADAVFTSYSAAGLKIYAGASFSAEFAVAASSTDGAASGPLLQSCRASRQPRAKPRCRFIPVRSRRSRPL